jgi:hypothetical protein
MFTQHLGLSAQAAIEFAGAIDHRAGFSGVGPQRRENAATLAKLLPAWAYIEIAFGLAGEVAARKGSARPLRLVEHLHARLDPALVHQPSQHLS